ASDNRYHRATRVGRKTTSVAHKYSDHLVELIERMMSGADYDLNLEGGSSWVAGNAIAYLFRAVEALRLRLNRFRPWLGTPERTRPLTILICPFAALVMAVLSISLVSPAKELADLISAFASLTWPLVALAATASSIVLKIL